MLISVEGCDLFGKSTLIKELSKHYINVVTTKEPGSPHVPSNQKIREMVLNDETLTPMQRELLFYADAIGHRRFLASQDAQTLILSDRGILTHYAYLYGYMKLSMLGADADENWTSYALCRQLIKQSCAKPDAIIYLDGDVALMDERRDRAKDAIESLPTEYFAYVLSQFDELVDDEERAGIPVLRLHARDSLVLNVSSAVNFVDHLR